MCHHNQHVCSYVQPEHQTLPLAAWSCERQHLTMGHLQDFCFIILTQTCVPQSKPLVCQMFSVWLSRPQLVSNVNVWQSLYARRSHRMLPFDIRSQSMASKLHSTHIWINRTPSQHWSRQVRVFTLVTPCENRTWLPSCQTSPFDFSWNNSGCPLVERHRLTFLKNNSGYPFGFGEIWRCVYRTNKGPVDVRVYPLFSYFLPINTSLQVAVKTIQFYNPDTAHDKNIKNIKVSTTKNNINLTNPNSNLQRIRREIGNSAGLRHRNILPVYGYSLGFGLLVAIVTPCAENGSLAHYLEHRGATLSTRARFWIVSSCLTHLECLLTALSSKTS